MLISIKLKSDYIERLQRWQVSNEFMETLGERSTIEATFKLNPIV